MAAQTKKAPRRDAQGRFAASKARPARPRRRIPAADRPDPNPVLPEFIVIRVVDGEPPVIDARGIDDYRLRGILELAAHTVWERMKAVKFLEG